MIYVYGLAYVLFMAIPTWVLRSKILEFLQDNTSAYEYIVRDTIRFRDELDYSTRTIYQDVPAVKFSKEDDDTVIMYPTTHKVADTVTEIKTVRRQTHYSKTFEGLDNARNPDLSGYPNVRTNILIGLGYIIPFMSLILIMSIYEINEKIKGLPLYTDVIEDLDKSDIQFIKYLFEPDDLEEI